MGFVFAAIASGLHDDDGGGLVWWIAGAHAAAKPAGGDIAAVTNNSPRPAPDQRRLIELAKLYTKVDRDLPARIRSIRWRFRRWGTIRSSCLNGCAIRHRTCHIEARLGPIGVLMDRNGNSLDRPAAGAASEHERPAGAARARHNRCRQSAAAQEHMGRCQTERGSARPPPLRMMQQSRKRPRLMAWIRTASQVDRAVAASRRNRWRMSSALLRSSRMHWPTCWATCNAAGGQYESQLAAISDHWWVQRSDNGTWSDLDPLTRDTPKPGQRFTSDPADTRPICRLIGTDFPPNRSLLHEVEVRVIAERTDGDRAYTSASVVLHQALWLTAALVRKLRQIENDPDGLARGTGSGGAQWK